MSEKPVHQMNDVEWLRYYLDCGLIGDPYIRSRLTRVLRKLETSCPAVGTNDAREVLRP